MTGVAGPVVAVGRSTLVLQDLPPMAELSATLAGVAALTLVVAGLAAAVAFPYRWYVRERIPAGLPVLVGLTIVATSIGTTGWLGQVIAGNDRLFSPVAILANIGVFVVAGVGALLGVSVGDRVARRVALPHAATGVGAVGGTLVKSVGRVVTVELPEEIDDVVGYDPVDPATKAALAGKRFDFPRRITVADLRARLTQRIKADFAVGHVDMELSDDGTVDYLAVGSREAGLGPTLPPETEAVAVRADPAFAASAGDLVQVWTDDPPERVLTAELRGVADDVVTLAVDAADVDDLDDRTTYKLVTLPVVDRPDREFASLLRAADETMGTATVATGSDLDGATLASVDANVVAIASGDGALETLPRSARQLAVGDQLYAIGTPEVLRKLELAAASPASADAGSDDVLAAQGDGDGGRFDDDD